MLSKISIKAYPFWQHSRDICWCPHPLLHGQACQHLKHPPGWFYQFLPTPQIPARSKSINYTQHWPQMHNTIKYIIEIREIKGYRNYFVVWQFILTNNPDTGPSATRLLIHCYICFFIFVLLILLFCKLMTLHFIICSCGWPEINNVVIVNSSTKIQQMRDLLCLQWNCLHRSVKHIVFPYCKKNLLLNFTITTRKKIAYT